MGWYRNTSEKLGILPNVLWDFFLEGVYVTIGNPAFCLFLYLTGVHFRGELQHVGDVREQKIKYWTIRIQEIGGVRLYVNRLYVKSINFLSQLFENITIMFLVVCV